MGLLGHCGRRVLPRHLCRSLAYSTDTQVPISRIKRVRKDRRQPRAIEGTVPFYERQLVVLDTQQQPRQWPKKLEESDHILATYVNAIASIQDPKNSPLKAITATEYTSSCTTQDLDAEPEETVLHELLIFPDNVRIHNMSRPLVESLVQALGLETPIDTLVSSLGLQSTSLPLGLHILVCTHDQRDFRCGCNGPLLLQWLQQIIETQDLTVSLYASSHFGGHRYAANCIVYPSGDWFGLMNSRAEAEELLRVMKEEEGREPHVQLWEHWRGRMGLTKEQQIEMVEVQV